VSFPYDLFDRGKIDKARYDRKLRDRLKKKLPSILARESIITERRGKKIKVKIELLENWKIKYGKEGKGVGMGGRGMKEGDYIATGEAVPGLPGQEPVGQVYEDEFTLQELIELMFEDLNLPHLEEKRRAKEEIESHRLEARTRKGMMRLIDKRQTFKEYLKRMHVQEREEEVGKEPLVNEDLRFRTFVRREKEVLNAVIFFVLDASGSMDNETLYIVKAFFFYLNEFLKKKYDYVERVFISHDTDAYIEPSEESFFKRSGAGGTMSSSAFKKVIEVVRQRYNPKEWNIYVFYFSDGENFEGDMDEAQKKVTELLDFVNLMGYGEIRLETSYYAARLLSYYLSRINHPRLIICQVKGKEDVVKAMETFLKKV